MRPKPEPISGLDPDLCASPKPRRWSDVCRPSLLAGLIAVGSLGVLSLAAGGITRAADTPARPWPIPPGAGPRVAPPQRVMPPARRPSPGRVDPFIVSPRQGIDDAMIIAAPRGIDDAMIAPRGRGDAPLLPPLAPTVPAPRP
ncbi:hypothetical protein OJF2_72080 [Aquisphaera giovannonii]|uniref:Uncharacterized protein n=1 Tax=Aquisphaera giovannonii TaxID=406548 RepID=A0A5B9WEG6_9BACT|nr:hypothetical protein [Aquisphaera giovannonii]QEH38604.1 hypothetical protein OJF2_72080 [Aquisphaera giovannonii]